MVRRKRSRENDGDEEGETLLEEKKESNIDLREDLKVRYPDEDVFLNKLFGIIDDPSECFICNYNKGTYPQVTEHEILNLNQIAAKAILRHSLAVAVRNVYREYENLRTDIDNMITGGRINGTQLPVWKEESIRFHYDKHANGLVFGMYKALKLNKHFMNNAPECMFYDDEDGRVIMNKEVVKALNGFNNSLPKLYDKIKEFS